MPPRRGRYSFRLQSYRRRPVSIEIYLKTLLFSYNFQVSPSWASSFSLAHKENRTKRNALLSVVGFAHPLRYSETSGRSRTRILEIINLQNTQICSPCFAPLLSSVARRPLRSRLVLRSQIARYRHSLD